MLGTAAGFARKLMLGLLFLLAFAQQAVAAPSACTAMWGVEGSALQYWNNSTSQWTTATTTGLGTTHNAIGGYAGNGSLYFSSAVGSASANMIRADFSNTSGTITFTNVGAIQAPAVNSLGYTSSANISGTWPGGNVSYVGATFDRNTGARRMFLYATGNVTNAVAVAGGGTSTAVAAVGLTDPNTPGAVSWQIIYQSKGPGSTITYPLLGNSGDIFVDQQTGQPWIISNTNPNRMYKLDLQYTGTTLSSAQVIGTASVAEGGSPLVGTQAGIAVNPINGDVYVSSGAGANTYRVTDHTAVPVIDVTLAQTDGVGDSGNCVEQPDPPVVSKAFNPVTSTATIGTSTMTVTITNPNKVPIFMTGALVDTLPTTLVFNSPSNLTITCLSDGAAATRPASVTATTSTTAMTIASGGMIPGGLTSGGSCSFSAVVRATVPSVSVNTIAAGELITAVGNNATGAQATYTWAPADYLVVKSQTNTYSANPIGAPLSTSAFTTASMTAIEGTTVTFLLSMRNGTAGQSLSTGTFTFSDTLPSRVSTVLAVSTTPVGLASCGAGTSTVGSFRVVSGTVTAAPSGAGCDVQITTLVRTASVAPSLNSAVNTVTVVGLGSLPGDYNTANNTATLGFTVQEAANFTVAKSQRSVSSTAVAPTTINQNWLPKSTVQYVITITNSSNFGTGTMTFLDTMPVQITRFLSLGTSTTAGGQSCRVVSNNVAGQTQVSGTVSLAGGVSCVITLTAVVGTTSVDTNVVNTVTLATVAGGTAEADPSSNIATVGATITPVNFSIGKMQQIGNGTADLSTDILYVTRANTMTYQVTVTNSSASGTGTATFTDTLPTLMTPVYTISFTATGGSFSCYGGTFTGGRVRGTVTAVPPGGGCVMKIVVRAGTTTTVQTTVTNTATVATPPAASPDVNASDNRATVTTVITPGVDFAVAKSQRTVTVAPYTAGLAPQTSVMTVLTGQTVQYVVKVINTSLSGSGSVSFTDTLPAQISPVLTISFAASGGGTCAASASTSLNRVTGTFIAALSGSTCTITVTAVSRTVALVTSVVNTATIAGLGGTTQVDSSNDRATVSLSLTPATLLTITKTNNTSTVASGGTTSYTITLANLGPMAADNSRVVDGTVTGLTCAYASCVATGGASCTGVTTANLQDVTPVTGGWAIPSFPRNSTISLVLSCTVTP
jgi:uncharacterized repeat protein (TIGR01451 family)